MLMEKARHDLVEYGKKLVHANLTKGTGGNLSVFDRANGTVAIVIVDLEGKTIEGTRTPSSEWEMHLMPYRHRTDIDAVIHAHTTYATVLAVLRQDLPPSHYMVEVAGHNVRCAPYATYGSHELAVNSYEYMKDRRAVLLANHGILAGAHDLLNAFNIIEEVEYCSHIHWMASCMGKPVILPDEEMELMAEKFKTYGQRKAKD